MLPNKTEKAEEARAFDRRMAQIKMVDKEEERKHRLKIEKLRHKQAMEELEFMAKNKITMFNLALSNRPMKNLMKQIQGTGERKRK